MFSICLMMLLLSTGFRRLSSRVPDHLACYIEKARRLNVSGIGHRLVMSEKSATVDWYRAPYPAV